MSETPLPRDQRRIVVQPGPAHSSRGVSAAPSAAPEWAGASDDPPHWDGPAPEWDDHVTAEPDPRRRRRRRRGLRVAVAIAALGVITIVALLITSWVLWNRVDKLDTEGSLAAASNYTNYLIVGTDSREGVSSDLDTAASIGLGVGGNRSDTMVVLHVGPEGNHMVSLPRDLWVTIDGGAAGKLNAASNGGPGALVRTIQSNLGVPLHHYLEVDIAGFLTVIDALGSITIDFPRAACDPKSGLDVRTSGPVELGPEQALAYVRSRTYTEFDPAAVGGMGCREIRRNGLGATVGNSDFGRTERQRRFLLATFDEVASIRNPVSALRVLGRLGDGLRVDERLGMWDAIGLLRNLRGLDATTHSLPVSDFTSGDGQAALVTNGETEAVLDLLRPGA